LFYFLVEVEFLDYLRPCEPPEKRDLRIVILEKIKHANLEFTSTAHFTH